jgi:hypothetical protein
MSAVSSNISASNCRSHSPVDISTSGSLALFMNLANEVNRQYSQGIMILASNTAIVTLEFFSIRIGAGNTCRRNPFLDYASHMSGFLVFPSQHQFSSVTTTLISTCNQRQ